MAIFGHYSSIMQKIYTPNSPSAPTFSWNTYKTEILAGLTVSMTMIPESLSFAILAGLSPLMGLYAAFIMGLVTAIFGGRPGMVSGGAGATIVVMIGLIASNGVEYLLAAVALAGLIQIGVGVFKLGKFVRLIPQPVMYGFLNGLAVIIFLSQLEQFKVINMGQVETWMSGNALYVMLGLTLATIAFVLIIPKFTKKIPASLLAIIIISVIVYFLGIQTKKVVDIASVSGGFPSFHIPIVPFKWETLEIIFPYAMIMAGVGLVESLLTLGMVDEITQTKGNSNKESIAQGAANMINGFFGGMGGCAMVAQTFVNLDSGGRTRWSAIVGALGILLVILIGGPVIEQIPMAALVGVMVMVAISTFKWGSFRLIFKMPKSDVFVGVLVALITILLKNLALAVLIGVIISALVFAWDNAKRIRARKTFDDTGRKVYEIYGPLFFGSTANFLEKFDREEDPETIIIDFKDSRIVDMSAIEAIYKLVDLYQKSDKEIIFRHLSDDCVNLLNRAGVQVKRDSDDNPTYKVMP